MHPFLFEISSFDWCCPSHLSPIEQRQAMPATTRPTCPRALRNPPRPAPPHPASPTKHPDLTAVIIVWLPCDMATRLAKGRAIAIDRTNIANDRRFELFLCSFLSPLFRSGEKRKDMVLLFKSYYSYVANHDTYPNQFVCTSFCTPTTTTPTHHRPTLLEKVRGVVRRVPQKN